MSRSPRSRLRITTTTGCSIQTSQKDREKQELRILNSQFRIHFPCAFGSPFTALYTVFTVPPGNHAAAPSGTDDVYVSVQVEPSVTVSAKVGPERPDPRHALHGPPALNAN